MNGGQDPRLMDQLMGLAAQQGGGGQPGMAPGGGAPGGMPPGMGAQPGMGGPPKQQNSPQEMIQAGLLALHVGLNMFGLNETSMKIIHMVQKSVERLQKMTPEGREGAVQAGALPSAAPPGVGEMPGQPMY